MIFLIFLIFQGFVFVSDVFTRYNYLGSEVSSWHIEVYLHSHINFAKSQIKSNFNHSRIESHMTNFCSTV